MTPKRSTSIETGPPQTPRSAAERAMVMSIFLDLVEVSLDDDPRRDVRCSVAKVDLIADHPERAKLIDELVAARLLSVERRGDQQVDTVDIIHETLLRNWDRLRAAVGERREALQQRERFRVAVAEWVEHERGDGYALNGVRLAEGRALAAGNDIALRDPAARAFLSRSLALAERDRRRGMAIVAGVVGVVFVAAIVSLYLLLEAQRAREQTHDPGSARTGVERGGAVAGRPRTQPAPGDARGRPRPERRRHARSRRRAATVTVALARARHRDGSPARW